LDTLLLKIQYPIEVNKAMIETLKDMCQREDWYKIQNIAKQFKLKIKWDVCSSRKAGSILTQLGFRRRDKRGSMSYTYIFIDFKTLNNLQRKFVS